MIPNRPKDLIAKPQYKKVVHNLLSQIMIDAENLIFSPIRIEGFLELARTFEVVAEWFLNLSPPVISTPSFPITQHDGTGQKMPYNDPTNPPLRITPPPQPFRHPHKHTRRQTQIEQSILLFLAMTNLLQSTLQRFESLIAAFMAGDIRAAIAELV